MRYNVEHIESTNEAIMRSSEGLTSWQRNMGGPSKAKQSGRVKSERADT